MDKILITGGSGLIGTRLSEELTKMGYVVSHLSRKPNPKSIYKTYKWDINSNYIDPLALNNVNHIIHLAGENVGKRWTKQTKKRIYDSRIKTAQLIYKNLKHPIKTFISASGVNYYGTITSKSIFNEKNSFGTDYLAKICCEWEKSAFDFKTKANRVISIRTPLTLSKKGGGLSKIKKPFELNLGSALGSGQQYMPWIHIDDLCQIYIESITNPKMDGAYNAVASEHCTNEKFTQVLAHILNKKIWAPSVPSFLLKIMLGEMSEIVLNGSRIDNSRIKSTGFSFKYDTLQLALKDCLT